MFGMRTFENCRCCYCARSCAIWDDLELYCWCWRSERRCSRHVTACGTWCESEVDVEYGRRWCWKCLDADLPNKLYAHDVLPCARTMYMHWPSYSPAHADASSPSPSSLARYPEGPELQQSRHFALRHCRLGSALTKVPHPRCRLEALPPKHSRPFPS